MSLTRRSFLAGAGALGITASLGACGRPGGARASAGDQLAFWYWPGALSDSVVRSVATSFASRAAIRPRLIDGDFKQRLTTTLSGSSAGHSAGPSSRSSGPGSSVPDITGVKGEDMPVFLTRADDFLDLGALGAGRIAGSFAAAKYAQARTTSGKQIGLPIDLGPTALFLRTDLWGKAGLPTDPAAVSALVSTWDGWFDAARRLGAALPGTFAVRNSVDVFGTALAQQSQTFLARSGDFVGDGGGVKVAWDLAVRSIADGVQAGIYDGDAFNAALSAGTLTGHVGPAWNGQDIESGAPGTSGAWHVAACPGGPANIGGSFLTLPGTCRNPEVAFAFIRELLSPANEAKGFEDASIFPATTAAYTLPALVRGQAFYGGQSTIEVFGPAAENLPVVYDAPGNAAVSAAYVTELSNVEGGKDAAQAWADAVAAGRQVAQAQAGRARP